MTAFRDRSGPVSVAAAVLGGLLLTGPNLAFAGFTATKAGTTAVFVGTNGNESIEFRSSGSFWLKHDRFTSGDPGFVSDLDFDSSAAGEQLQPNNGTSLVSVEALGGDDTLFFNDFEVVNSNNVYLITSALISFSVSDNRPAIAYSHVEHIKLRPQLQCVGAQVRDTAAGKTTEILNAPDSFTTTIGSPGGSLGTIHGAVTVTGGRLVFGDGSDIGSYDYTVDWDYVGRTGMTPVRRASTKAMDIYASNGANRFFLKSNGTPEFRLLGTYNSDLVFGSDAAQLDSIVEPVELYNAPRSLTLVDTGATHGHTYFSGFGGVSRDSQTIATGGTYGATILGGPFGDVFAIDYTGSGKNRLDAGVGGGVDILDFNCFLYPFVVDISGQKSVIQVDGFERTAFSGFEYVFLNGNGGPDNISASPATTYTIVLSGAAPDTAPGDQISLHSYGKPFALGVDSFQVAGYEPLMFEEFESVTPPTLGTYAVWQDDPFNTGGLSRRGRPRVGAPLGRPTRRDTPASIRVRAPTSAPSRPHRPTPGSRAPLRTRVSGCPIRPLERATSCARNTTSSPRDRPTRRSATASRTCGCASPIASRSTRCSRCSTTSTATRRSSRCARTSGRRPTPTAVAIPGGLRSGGCAVPGGEPSDGGRAAGVRGVQHRPAGQRLGRHDRERHRHLPGNARCRLSPPLKVFEPSASDAGDLSSSAPDSALSSTACWRAHRVSSRRSISRKFPSYSEGTGGVTDGLGRVRQHRRRVPRGDHRAGVRRGTDLPSGCAWSRTSSTPCGSM